MLEKEYENEIHLRYYCTHNNLNFPILKTIKNEIEEFLCEISDFESEKSKEDKNLNDLDN